jgi:hypothetical protein
MLQFSPFSVTIKASTSTLASDRFKSRNKYYILLMDLNISKKVGLKRISRTSLISSSPYQKELQ